MALLPQKPHRVKELEINGRKPFAAWLAKLRDKTAKAAVLARITRIEEAGNFGAYRYLQDRVFELKITIGPGYRVYFGLEEDLVVLLLLGGDKSGQGRDIKKAKRLWQIYNGDQ